MSELSKVEQSSNGGCRRAGREKKQHSAAVTLVVLSLAASAAAAQCTEMGLYESMECGYAIIRALNAKSTKPLGCCERAAGVNCIRNLHNTLMQIKWTPHSKALEAVCPGMTEEAINKCRAAASLISS